MQNLKFLNSKEKRELKKKLAENYDFEGEIEGFILLSTKEERVYVLSGAELLPDKFDKEARVDRAGLYIGKIISNGVLLNVEGSQIIGPLAKKNILEIDDSHLEPWLKGEDFSLLEKEKSLLSSESGIFIVKHKDDFFGSAIIKNGSDLNQISKSRQLKNVNI
jgi:NOL1/NOP2/fmu family ribosome biogenesis protein